MESREAVGLSWIVFVVTAIICYLIGYASLDVFETCPSNSEDRILAQSNKLAIASMVFTSLTLLGVIALVFMGFKGCVKTVIENAIYKSDAKVKVMGIAVALFGVISLILTAFSEFAGVETVNSCEVIKAKDQEEVSKFMKSANMLNRLYSIVILVLVFAGLIIVNGLSLRFTGFDPWAMLTYSIGGFMDNASSSGFGRRCSRKNGIKRA